MNRRVKKVDETSNNTTWYVRGPGGKTHAIYKDNGSGAAKAEQFMYGKSRLGTKYTGNDPAYMYEIRDHLGNVRAVIDANAVDDAGTESLLSWSDYYPFGSRMRRSDIPGYGKYRYGYQGKFAEDEINDDGSGFVNFELRTYDPVIGRWMSPDPMGQYPSPYTGMGNDPIRKIDPRGGQAGDPPSCTQCSFVAESGLRYSIDAKGNNHLLGAGPEFHNTKMLSNVTINGTSINQNPASGKAEPFRFVELPGTDIAYTFNDIVNGNWKAAGITIFTLGYGDDAAKFYRKADDFGEDVIKTGRYKTERPHTKQMEYPKNIKSSDPLELGAVDPPSGTLGKVSGKTGLWLGAGGAAGYIIKEATGNHTSKVHLNNSSVKKDATYVKPSNNQLNWNK